MSTTPSPNDDRYRIPGANIMNWTKYSRENIPKDPPKYAVGAEVVIVGWTHITAISQDCDGTPLYETAGYGHSHSEESFIPLPDDYEDVDGPLPELVAALQALGWTIKPPPIDEEA